jgi:hypothetical protein
MTMSNTPPGLIQDLQSVGVPVRDIWELVNSRDQYPAAIPVLMDWLRDLDARAQGPGTTIGAFCNSGVCLAPPFR